MAYNIIRSRRKSIAIEIDRTGEVIVRAPYRMSNADIKAFIDEKQGWIDKHLQRIQVAKEKAKAVEPLTEEQLRRLAEEASEDIPERAEKYADIMGVTFGRITIRNQKTRWGSCSEIGNLNFNCLLMLVPEDVRDYVIIHELAHRKYMNHSADFWKEVELMLPDYKDKRKWLKEHGDEVMQRMFAMR